MRCLARQWGAIGATRHCVSSPDVVRDVRGPSYLVLFLNSHDCLNNRILSIQRAAVSNWAAQVAGQVLQPGTSGF